MSVECKVEIADPRHPSDTIVAGDFGVVRRVTFSDGAVVPPIDVAWEENRKAFYQRTLKNKRKFSQNWKKVFRKISKLASRIAKIRKDATHKFTSAYSKNHAVIKQLWKGGLIEYQSRDSAAKQEPLEEAAQCA